MAELMIDIPGLRIAAQVAGADDAPPLLALHGWLDNSASFGLLAPLLTDSYRVIAVDLPGHGHSGHLAPGMRYHFIDYVRAVLATADALGLNRFALLGHSMGAGIASLVAAAAPARISELFLIEGLGPIADDGSRTLQRFRDGLESDGGKPRALRIFPDSENAVAARVAVAQMDAALVRGIVERSLRTVEGGFSWRSDPRLADASPLRMSETQLLSLLLGIEAPTALLLADPRAPYLDEDTMQVRIDCVGDIRVQTLAGGHHLHLEFPEQVASWLLRRPLSVS